MSSKVTFPVVNRNAFKASIQPPPETEGDRSYILASAHAGAENSIYKLGKVGFIDTSDYIFIQPTKEFNYASIMAVPVITNAQALEHTGSFENDEIGFKEFPDFKTAVNAL